MTVTAQEQAQDKARTLIEALPHMQQYDEETVVITNFESRCRRRGEQEGLPYGKTTGRRRSSRSLMQTLPTRAMVGD